MGFLKQEVSLDRIAPLNATSFEEKKKKMGDLRVSLEETAVGDRT